MKGEILYEHSPLSVRLEDGAVVELRRKVSSAGVDWNTSVSTLVEEPYSARWICSMCGDEWDGRCIHMEAAEEIIEEERARRIYVWRTNLRHGRVRVTVAISDRPRAAQAKHQAGVIWMHSLEAPRRALRDGSLRRRMLEAAEGEEMISREDLEYLDDALWEAGV